MSGESTPAGKVVALRPERRPDAALAPIATTANARTEEFAENRRNGPSAEAASQARAAKRRKAG